MTLAGTAKWVALALIGLAIAVGVAIAASNLTSRQIGISGESVSAGDALAPSLRTSEEREAAGGHGGRRKPPVREEKAPTREGTVPRLEPVPPEEPAPPSEAAEPPAEGGDDYGGGGDD